MNQVQKEFSVKEFQDNFSALFSRVESGETLTIYDGPNRFLIMPIDLLPYRWRATD